MQMLPLEGLIVVAVEQAVAAPFCSSRLADAGAHVIKVERPEGDFARGYDAAAKGQSSYFVWLNRGKESEVIDLATKVEPSIEVVFIDTGYHFPETLDTVEIVRRRYGLNLRIMSVPHHDEELWRIDPENCCSAVKVGQLDRALNGKLAWMSGLRRAESR